MGTAIPGQELSAGHTSQRLERTRSVVNAGMNNVAVARARVHAEMPLALDNHDGAPLARERSRRGEADHAGADHNAIHLVHRVAPPRKSLRRAHIVRFRRVNLSANLATPSSARRY